MATRNCPYCEHPNSTDAKYCIVCGAAMHLVPCPSCGAVNPITSKSCYRCHVALPDLLAAVKEDPAPAATAATAEGAVSAADTDTPQRPSILVVGVIMLAFIAAAYYAYRQRTNLDPKAPAATGAAKTGTGAATDTTIAVPRPATEPPARPADPKPETPSTAAPTTTAPAISPVSAPAAAPAMAIREAPAASTGKPERPVKSAVEPAAKAPAPARPAASTTPAPPTAPPVPCTEGVAALGLCKLDPSPKKE